MKEESRINPIRAIELIYYKTHFSEEMLDISHRLDFFTGCRSRVNSRFSTFQDAYLAGAFRQIVYIADYEMELKTLVSSCSGENK